MLTLHVPAMGSEFGNACRRIPVGGGPGGLGGAGGATFTIVALACAAVVTSLMIPAGVFQSGVISHSCIPLGRLSMSIDWPVAAADTSAPSLFSPGPSTRYEVGRSACTPHARWTLPVTP